MQNIARVSLHLVRFDCVIVLKHALFNSIYAFLGGVAHVDGLRNLDPRKLSARQAAYYVERV